MKRTYAFVMAFAALLIATVATADPRPEETQAPRGDERIEAPYQP